MLYPVGLTTQYLLIDLLFKSAGPKAKQNNNKKQQQQQKVAPHLEIAGISKLAIADYQAQEAQGPA